MSQRIAALTGALALLILPTWPAAGDSAAERCAEVLSANAGDGGSPHEAARCWIDAGRFDEALERLESAPAGDAEAALLRGMAWFHLGRIADAERELARLEPQLSERAELHFYRGMIHLQRSQWSEAAARLDRARRIDPAGVEPVASFHAARAWVALADRMRAQEALERVARDWPGTPWAAQSRRQLAALRARTPAARWLLLEGGLEFDDNAVLRGDGVQLPREISDQRDRRVTWLLHGGSELLKSDPWAGGAAFTYSGAAHHDLDAFDSHYPALTFWLDRKLEGAGTLRGTYDFGYAWVEGDAFLSAHDASLGLYRGSDWGTTGLIARGYARDFRFANPDEIDANPGGDCPVGVPVCGAPGIDEGHERNRDGLGYALGLEHTAALWNRSGQARVRAEIERYHARGSEYSFGGESLSGTLRVPLPLDLLGSVTGGWARRAHRHSSTFGDPDFQNLAPTSYFFARGRDRRDRELRFETELVWPLGEQWAALARWSWRDQHSTSEVFDYTERVLGIYLRMGLGESGP